MLIALSGLPGTGKTTVARILARHLSAVHVRVDTIEQALLRAGFPAPPGPEGYVVAYGVAADNLRLGHRVIADCVNGVQASWDAWAKVATECRAGLVPVQLVCKDGEEHRRRVLGRQADIEGHLLPTWEQVCAMRCDPPSPGTLTIDTSACTAESVAEQIVRCVISTEAGSTQSALESARPRQSIGHVSLVVRDYDEALAFFVGTLGFDLIEDTYIPAQDKRWVLVAPPGSRETRLLLARASDDEQRSRVGAQTGGRVFLFLHTDDFWRDYERLRGKGVKFRRLPKDEAYGTVAVFEDLYGNLWDLLQLRG